MSYLIFLKKSAEKEIDYLPKKVYSKMINKLNSLSKEPRPVGIKKLKNLEGYRLRIGDYRVLYMVDDSLKKVEIYSIAHRKDVYK
jgi:mRNA interferase RelE/StbE